MAGLENIRAQFPILSKKINGHPLVYLDNAATTHKPQSVIDSVSDYYASSNSNIHRGVHTLSQKATALYEDARTTCATFFNVKNPQQIVFTAGTTDSVNLAAQGLAKALLRSGDEILVTTYEHHSNILPWQMWAQENNGRLKAAPLKEDNTLDYDALERMITERTRVIAVTHVSNSLGLVTDLARIKRIISDRDIVLFVDGAQSAPHLEVDLAAMDPDFFACSAHKMYGPTGTGILYMSERWLASLPVTRPGGGTIRTVSFEETEYEQGALRFEPGTPNIAGVVGFAAALRFMEQAGRHSIMTHESRLTALAHSLLDNIEGVTVYGKASEKAGVISFNVSGAHPFDVGTLLDKSGIAVRTGHHCTQPLMKCINVPGTVRISFAAYNTEDEVRFFADKLHRCIRMLS